MAKKKAATSATPAKPKSVPKWDPSEKGQYIAGGFVLFQEVEAGLVLVLDTAAVNVGTVLRSLLAPIYRNIRPGDQFKITYGGTQGRTKIFDAEYNGKRLERQFTPADPATAQAVDTFFSDDWEFPEKKS